MWEKKRRSTLVEWGPLKPGKFWSRCLVVTSGPALWSCVWRLLRNVCMCKWGKKTAPITLNFVFNHRTEIFHLFIEYVTWNYVKIQLDWKEERILWHQIRKGWDSMKKAISKENVSLQTFHVLFFINFIPFVNKRQFWHFRPATQ